MSVVVIKSPLVVIRPSELTPPTRTINLSSLDRSLSGISITSILAYDHPIQEPVESIRNALSQALVHYYPLAGRLAVGAKDGELTIACTGDGFLFVAASANCTLESAKVLEPSVCTEPIKDLRIDAPAHGWCHTDPLLLMQVTEFSCGGFLVGVTWNHITADGKGMAQFLQAVGELARGLSPLSVIPIRCDESVARLSSMAVVAKQGAISLKQPDFAFLDITVPSSFIRRIKAEFAHHCNGEPCTTFEIVTAVLWQSRTRALMFEPNAHAPLVFAANMRKHIGASKGYYGNCVTAQVVMATSAAVAHSTIKDVVKLIRPSSKEKIPNMNMCKNGEIDSMSGIGMEQLGMLFAYNALYVTSCLNLGFDAADFGGGRPARVMCHIEEAMATLPACVLCPPSKGRDGINALSRCVKEEHAITFRGESAKYY